MSKLHSRKVNVVDVDDFDQLVQNTYGRPYNFQQQNGCRSRGTESFHVPVEQEFDFENDEIPEKVNDNEMGVSFSAWLARDPKQKLKDQKYDWELEMFWERNFYPSLDMIVKDLHAKGLLDPGEYTIMIDW